MATDQQQALQTPLMPAAMDSMLQVMVPNGATAGQQLAVTTPDGRRVMATTCEDVAPGTSVTVAYKLPKKYQMPSNADLHGIVVPTSSPIPPSGVTPTTVSISGGAALPIPAVSEAVVGGEQDREAAKWSWVAYGSALGCCCCCPGLGCVVAPIIFVVTSSLYFCKPSHDRHRFPRQGTVALWSVSTCVVFALFVWFCIVGSVGFAIGLFSKDHGVFHHDVRDPDEVDWDTTFVACPAMAAYGREICAHGPHSCKRKPTEVELSSMCQELSRQPCAVVATATGAASFFDEPCVHLRESMDARRNVDRKKTFEACHEWGRFASDHCASGLCDRDPNEKEMTNICVEFGRQPCNHIAEVTGAARVIEKPCRHFLENATSVLLDVAGAKQNIRGSGLQRFQTPSSVGAPTPSD
eukprot:TRINITY_DN6255_c1_g3_i1.p1 TRINITY_DN6255_c1_g3~~TRINITY_DN6255_c1_g3_i1.p1  ORF type:complete len:435 (-),score=63.32 TRINITY_DN6255_c1_g3_i1:95-1324(-)